MKLELGTLADDRTHVSRRYAPEVFEPTDDFRVVGEVSLELDVRRRAEQYDVSGRLQAPLELTCGRCLEGMPLTVDAEVALTYVPEAADPQDADHEVADEDFSVESYRDGAIDLGALIREQIYLAMPMKPLCSSGCLGLCPVCGRNRNRDACTCEARWDDPRWAGLKPLSTSSSSPNSG